MKFVEVAVDAPISENKTFSYSVPPDMSLEVGHLVLVPFGKRMLQGIVVETGVIPSVENTRDVSEIVFSDPIIDSFRMKLAMWMSEYYICSIFDSTSLMFPVGSHNRSETLISIGNSPEPFVGSEFQSKIRSFVRDHESISLERILSRFGGRARASIDVLVNKGELQKDIKTPKPSVRPKYRYVPVMTELGVKAIRESDLSRSPKQKAALEYLLNDRSGLTMPRLRKLFGSQPVKHLLAKEFIYQVKEKISRDPDLGVPHRNILNSTSLTFEQKNAAELASHIIREPEFSPRAMLLYGVTGSGKTEVYLNAVDTCLSEGKRAIILVPEIALTPQTIDRFSSRFPGDIAVLHSGLSPGERYDQWWKIKNGHYRLVIGSRSAIFAPQPDLGLVVIDEEHEWAYKQNEGSPKYHARDVSMHLAGITKAAVILGSASPDIESYQRAIRGRYKIAKLQNRFKKVEVLSENMEVSDNALTSHMASVKVVDMREELKGGNTDIFSRELISNLKQTIDDGNQAILFLNRRGSHGFIQCHECGLMQRCRSCDVGLTFHSDTNSLICHYCSASRRFTNVCTDCGGGNLSKYGVGTQLVAERFRELFPGVPAVRWDKDAAKNLKDYRNILRGGGLS